MSGKPFSLYFLCWYVETHGQRVPSERQTPPEGGHSWATRQSRHWNIKRIEGLDFCAQALLSGSLLGVPYYHHSVKDDSVNNHVFKKLLQGFPLSYPTVAMEGGPVMATRLCRHLEPGPVRLQYSYFPGTHVISH